MIRARHPHVADDIVVALTRDRPAFHLQGANACRAHLADVGLDPPDWGDAARQFDPPRFEFEETGPGVHGIALPLYCTLRGGGQG